MRRENGTAGAFRARRARSFRDIALIFLLAPVGLTLTRALDLWIVTPTLVITVLPVGLIVYYLAWKHIVGFFNQLLEVG